MSENLDSSVQRAVVYLRPDHGPLASHYASLTGRHTVWAANGADFANLKHVDIVVALFEDLTPEHFDSIHELTLHRKAPGIVSAPTTEKLEIKIRSRLIEKFRVDRLSETLRKNTAGVTDVLPLTRFETFKKNARTILGGYASHSDVRKALNEGVELLRIVTTSDGIDADLGSGRVLCPFENGIHPKGLSKKVPLCVDTGFCHRTDTLGNSLNENPRVLFASDVRANILIWHTCSGVMSFSSTIDDEWGIGRRFIDSPFIGALVTTIDCVVTNPSNSEKLIDGLLAGRSVSEAVTQYARSVDYDPLTHRMFVFGDPDTKIDPSLADQTQVPRILPFSRPADLDIGIPNLDAEVQLMTAIAKRGPERYRHLYNGIRDELKELLPRDKMSKSIKRRLIGYMVTRQWVRWMDDWVNFAVNSRRHTIRTECLYCRSLGNTLVYEFVAGASRKATVCPRCGPIEDAPISSDVQFLVDGGICQLWGKLPQKEWLAYLVVFTGIASDTVIVQWPADPGGMPKSRFCPEIEWPDGPLRVAFYMIERSWTTLSHPYRKG